MNGYFAPPSAALTTREGHARMLVNEQASALHRRLRAIIANVPVSDVDQRIRLQRWSINQAVREVTRIEAWALLGDATAPVVELLPVRRALEPAELRAARARKVAGR